VKPYLNYDVCKWWKRKDKEGNAKGDLASLRTRVKGRDRRFGGPLWKNFLPGVLLYERILTYSQL